MTGEPPITAALARKGFAVTSRRGDVVRLARRDDGRHDHVRLALAPRSWWRRLGRRPRRVTGILAGVVWPIGEQAFSRPVPVDPVLPGQGHAATGFDALCRSGLDPATIAAAIDDWFRRLEDPAVALDLGAIADAVRRLEFAVVTSRREVGLAAAEVARREARGLAPGPSARALERIELAEQRLPRG